MAPEILLSQPYIGNVVDLFSLGVIFFYLRAGRRPFEYAHVIDDYYKLLESS